MENEARKLVISLWEQGMDISDIAYETSIREYRVARIIRDMDEDRPNFEAPDYGDFDGYEDTPNLIGGDSDLFQEW